MPDLKSSRRVLVVDDQRDATTVLASLLTRLGYVSQTTNDSRKALEAVREFHPQVILLDIAMPHLTGYEVARRVRSEPGFENVPIVAISAFDDDEHRKQARAAGIEHQLVKPCDFAKLNALIARLSP